MRDGRTAAGAQRRRIRGEREMFGKKFQLNSENLKVIEEIGRHMPGGFFIYKADEPEELLYANHAVYKIFGCEDEDEFRALTGNTFKGMLHPDDYESVSKSIEEQVGGDEAQMDYTEYRIIRRDGAVRWVDDYGHYTQTEAYGGIYYVFISDITEKHERAETDKAMRQAVIEALSEAYVTVWLITDLEKESFSLYRGDTNGETVHSAANLDALKHIKYSQAKDQYIRTMVAKADQPRLQRELSLKYISKRLTYSPHYNMNYLRVMPDGTERYFRIEFVRMNMPNGKMGVVCGFKDVDRDVRRGQEIQQKQQRELEERLALQEQLLEQEKYRAQLDSMITAMASDYRSVYHVDLDNNEAVCYRSDPNDPDHHTEGMRFPFYERFAEYGETHIDEQYREGYRQFIDPDHIRQALLTESIIAYRYLAHRESGEYYEMLRMAGVRHPADRDDHIVHAVGIGFTVIDAEMRESLEQRRVLIEALDAARQANFAKTSFLSRMSHEIRTPMNAVIGLNSLALKDETLLPKTREYLYKTGESAKHLLGLINDILDMSRIESGRMVLRNETFSFSAIMEQINTMVMSQCSDKGLKYECRILSRVDDHYIGDDMKLKEVLINILSNAVKFTDAPGHITMTVERTAIFGDQSTMKFCIEDTGIGMDKEFIPKIFDPFSQEDGSRKSKYGSTGLGMAITKNIVEMMNGTIEVESEKGVGSRFTVIVSLRNCEKLNTKREIDPSTLKVLVVDDDEIAAEHTRTVLDEVGIRTDMCFNGEAALNMLELQHAKQEPYNLVLMDWKMPGMDGLETTRRIREHFDSKTTVIILTAYNWDEIESETIVDSFLAKPLFASNVLEEFERVARRNNMSLFKEKKRAELKGRRILLAEDMEANAEIMMDILSLEDMEADHAENGRIALEMFKRSQPGLYSAILMDVRMPVMDGLESAAAIRALDRPDAGAIPIIALTANAFDEDVQRSLQAGMNAHLTKPVETDGLFQTLGELIYDAENSAP